MRVIVMTTQGSLYGMRLLNLLRWHDITVHQVVVFTDTLRRQRRLFRRAVDQIGWSQALLYSARQIALSQHSGHGAYRGQTLDHEYRRLAERVDFVRDPRSPEAKALLLESCPDVCVLAQSGIIPRSILKIPTLATLNAHPGILPEYRGIDTFYWALYEQRPLMVGSTLHVVDAGIDTGRVLVSTPYRWIGDETLRDLPRLVYEDCLDLLVDALSQELPQRLERSCPQAAGRYHHLMPPRLLPQVERALQTHISGLLH